MGHRGRALTQLYVAAAIRRGDSSKSEGGSERPATPRGSADRHGSQRSCNGVRLFLCSNFCYFSTTSYRIFLRRQAIVREELVTSSEVRRLHAKRAGRYASSKSLPLLEQICADMKASGAATRARLFALATKVDIYNLVQA